MTARNLNLSKSAGNLIRPFVLDAGPAVLGLCLSSISMFCPPVAAKAAAALFEIGIPLT